MAIKLREDQMMLVERVLKNIREDNLVVSPSGSGKSYILAYLEKLLTEQGYLVYVYAPTIEGKENRGDNQGYERTIWERFNSNAVFEKNVELKEVIKDYNSVYDELIEKALLKRNMEGYKILLDIERDAGIKSYGKYTWSYSFALEYDFDVPFLEK